MLTHQLNFFNIVLKIITHFSYFINFVKMFRIPLGARSEKYVTDIVQRFLSPPTHSTIPSLNVPVERSVDSIGTFKECS